MTAVTSLRQRNHGQDIFHRRENKRHHQYQKSAEMHDEINRRREVDSRQ